MNPPRLGISVDCLLLSLSAVLGTARQDCFSKRG